MKKVLIATALVIGFSATAEAESYGKPCTATPKEKWLSIEALEKIVSDHGYTVAKSKFKGTCVEVYARDKQGQRVELFLDPATGNPADAGWANPTKQGS
jgi:hypothetical protein